ncbi:MAG: cell division protein ZapA [Gemmobacter sp.]|nr:cell division protein ZapA [Gemmobacter sp.]
MPELEVTIGGRNFQVACQHGEEPFLISAAAMLNAEAEPLMAQAARLPENKMLLMAGLMLADRLAGIEDQLRVAMEHIEGLESRPAERVEVPIVPIEVTELLAEIAARTESLAAEAEEQVAAQAG